MREILFRGRDKNTRKWVCGFFSYSGGNEDESGEFLIENTGGWFSNVVESDTVGQYMGLNDKNGKKIFEGDIIKWDPKEWGGEYTEVVTWDYELFSIRRSDWPQFCEVVGNIYDNPELLEGQP